MKTTIAGGSESDTIMQGVVLLWSPTGWPLSLIVLFASIMIPSAKILALLHLVITVKRGSIQNNAQRVRLYRMVEIIGRWSMVDVFVDTFTVALIQLQPLMLVQPGPGLLFFAAVVVLTMLAVESSDPRPIWYAAGAKEIKREVQHASTTTNHSRSASQSAKIVPQKRTRAFVRVGHPHRGGRSGSLDRGHENFGEGAGDHNCLLVRGRAGSQQLTKIEYDIARKSAGSRACKLQADRKHVIATAAMHPKTQEFLVKDMKFWVVKPRISGLNVTGWHLVLRCLHRRAALDTVERK